MFRLLRLIVLATIAILVAIWLSNRAEAYSPQPEPEVSLKEVNHDN